MALGDGIRRDVQLISKEERNRLRDAFIKLKLEKEYPDGVSYWDKQQDIYVRGDISRGFASFLPWHREMCNRFEALLREVDPALSLHYWKWTKDPRSTADGRANLFTPQFMGSANGDAGTPLEKFGSLEPGHKFIWRDLIAGAPAITSDVVIISGEDILTQQDQYHAMAKELQGAYLYACLHYIRGTIGGDFRFVDPFAFLLHSNVDRLWAMWQTALEKAWRIDPEQVYGIHSHSLAASLGIEPWANKVLGPDGLRPWAPPENQQKVKTFFDPSVIAPPLYDTDPSGGFVTRAAVMWNAFPQKAYFFRGKHYSRYDVLSDKVDPGYPKLISANWPGLWTDKIDAAVVWNNGKAYFFRGDQYMRYDMGDDKVDSGYPKPIAGNWPGLWIDKVDAAVMWNALPPKAYFFRGNQYIRYDVLTDKADPGYPKPISGNWPGLWDDRVDAAVMWNNGKAYFFRGSRYIRYDVSDDKADPGYPKRIVGNWPGLR